MRTIQHHRLLPFLMMLCGILLVTDVIGQNTRASLGKQETTFQSTALHIANDKTATNEVNAYVIAEPNVFIKRKHVPYGFPLQQKNKSSDEGPRILVGANILTIPFKTKYIFVEGETKLANKLSATVRISYASLHRETPGRSYGTKTEESKGAGVGASVRYYFTGDGQLKGFFTGLGVEVMFGKWNNYHEGVTDPVDYGTYTAPAPHVDLGYKFLLGKQKRFYLDPMVALGIYSSTSHNDRNDTTTADVGFFGFPGLTFGIKLL